MAPSVNMGFLKGLLIRLGSTALAFWLATLLIPGITLDTGSATEAVVTLVLVAVIFGVVNAVRPSAAASTC